MALRIASPTRPETSRRRRRTVRATALRAAGSLVRFRSSSPAGSVREPATTATRLRVLALLVVVAVGAAVALLTVEVNREHTGLEVIGHKTAPVVVASSDLYFALNDMDAQLANVLLVGNDMKLGFTRADALKIYQQDRQHVSVDLQQAAANAQADPGAAKAVRAILDGLGQYETLAAQLTLLDDQNSHPAGRPAAAILAEYRKATDLLKNVLLPSAQGLVDRNSQILESTYEDQRGLTLTIRNWMIALGIAILASLILLQVYLAHQFHRLLNPALAAATLIAATLAICGTVLISNGAEYLRVAKKDSFDSVLALDRARAVSYDANADESRYLVDPGRADQYEQAFFTKTQQLVTLNGARLYTFDQRLATALRAYQQNNDNIQWQGFFGDAFRNITFVGEPAAAEKTIQTYQTYQVDDRRIRKLATSGQLRDAIAFCTSYNPGASNYHFSQYDNALSAWTDINQMWFDRSIRDGEGQLDGWTVIPAVAGLGILGLLLLGLRGRLREYH
jgi:hypothetical protein